MWISDVLPRKIIAAGPLLIALIVRPFYRRLRIRLMLNNYSYMVSDYVLMLNNSFGMWSRLH